MLSTVGVIDRPGPPARRDRMLRLPPDGRIAMADGRQTDDRHFKVIGARTCLRRSQSPAGGAPSRTSSESVRPQDLRDPLRRRRRFQFPLSLTRRTCAGCRRPRLQHGPTQYKAFRCARRVRRPVAGERHPRRTVDLNGGGPSSLVVPSDTFGSSSSPRRCTSISRSCIMKSSANIFPHDRASPRWRARCSRLALPPADADAITDLQQLFRADRWREHASALRLRLRAMALRGPDGGSTRLATRRSRGSARPTRPAVRRRHRGRTPPPRSRSCQPGQRANDRGPHARPRWL